MSSKRENLDKSADMMLDKIMECVRQEIKKSTPRIESAIVQNINQDKTVDVYLPANPNDVFTRIKNESIYQDLQVGDGVELLLKNGSFSNCWIIAKH